MNIEKLNRGNQIITEIAYLKGLIKSPITFTSTSNGGATTIIISDNVNRQFGPKIVSVLVAEVKALEEEFNSL